MANSMGSSVGSSAGPPSSYPQRIGEAHCRDYLRTGRCKYGESCKYHHPPNVASGGGIKTPLNPSEPPFPIRPNEPPCQYFLKHGTCKFGQQCKFDHPEVSSSSNNSSNFANNNHSNNNNNEIAQGQGSPSTRGQGSLGPGSPQLPPQGPPSTLVILPQRPSAPDCLYFLRHGRCKYGATCKYHHPLHGTNSPFSNVGRHPSVRNRSSRNCDSRNRSSSMGSHNDIMGSTDMTIRPLSYPGSAPMHILVEGPVFMRPTLTYYSNTETTQQRTCFSNPPMPPSLQLPPLCRAPTNTTINPPPNPSPPYYPTSYAYNPNGSPQSTPRDINSIMTTNDDVGQHDNEASSSEGHNEASSSSEIHPWDDGLSKMTSALLHMLDTPSCEEVEEEGEDARNVTRVGGATTVMGRRKSGFYG